MQTLRKKNSPCKFKNDPTRFLGAGVSFKAKLIGILEVSEARGDRMCQAALADLKMAIRAAGEHKQRIVVQVSIDGLRLRDEKTGDCLYHHPVHKISFIAQDMSDSRAFGYIFGSPDNGHRFFGIKTDKAASQVVIAMRDLFQVVFELKKKEIELAKQHIEQNAMNVIKCHTSGIFVEPAPDTKGAAGAEAWIRRLRTAPPNNNSEVEKPADRKNESQSGIIADLLDLQFELNSLQQGIHQMDKITPDNPVASSDDLFETDPFGDSFANMKLKETVQPILPPPPSSAKRGHLERQQTIPAPTSSATSSPATTVARKTPPPPSSIHWFDKETENLFNDGELATLAKSGTNKKDQDDNSLNSTPRNVQAKSPQIDVFTELDPLGTGLIKPYIDKKDFFQHLKNPPKKVLKDLVSTNASETFPTNFNITEEPLDSIKVQNDQPSKEGLEDGNFANFDRFDENQAAQGVQQPESPRKKEPLANLSHHQPLSVSLPPEDTSFPKSTVVEGAPAALIESIQVLNKLPPKKFSQSVKKKDFDVEKPFPVDFNVPSDSPASPLRSCSSDANSRLSSSSTELELVPEPPPRGAASILINPPPLPPKKQIGRTGVKPPPRPPHGDEHFHYDFLEREKASPSPTGVREKHKRYDQETKTQFDDNFSPPPHLPSRPEMTGRTITTSAFEDSFNAVIPSSDLSSLFTCTSTPTQSKKTKPSLDITLSQLTSSNLAELANSLDMTVQELTSLTLQQLTECLATLSAKEAARNEAEELSTPTKTVEQSSAPKAQPASKIVETSFVPNETLFKTAASFTQEQKQESTYDKYAVFRELFEMEQLKEEVRSEENNEEELADPEQKESEETEVQEEERTESEAETIVSLTNLTVRLPPTVDDLVKEDYKLDKINGIVTESTTNKDGYSEDEENDKEQPKVLDISLDSLSKQTCERTIESESEEKTDNVIEDPLKSDTAGRVIEDNSTCEKIQTLVENKAEEFSSSSVTEVTDIKPSTSTSSDRYAALREIIGEAEVPTIKNDDEGSSRRSSPAAAMQSSSTKSLAEVELLNLFSDNIPPASSPKKPATKKEDDLKAVAMDIFEEIKMLNTGTNLIKEVKPTLATSGFEDMFCPFAETKQERIENKDDGNWAKFDANVFASDRSSCEGMRSVGGTSPWSPDGKEVHRDPAYKGSLQRHSGDSDNEWKDEEESEESNGRVRGEGRYWCAGRHTRFEGSSYEERSVYDLEPPASADRQRSFRERGGRKSRSGVPWAKNAHRSCDPSPWHEEGQWEEEPRRYPHRGKIPYKDEEETQYEAHWKCRTKPQRWPWAHEPPHGPYYDDERKRKMMLWNEEDRFGSQESMGYDDDDRWSRRKYERRRWEEDARFWGRRPPPEGEYPMRESSYYYYREGRERPHDYVPPSAGWEEEYGPERPADESPRYNLPPGRKRHWPKRPNSANEGRNSDVPYHEPRSKFGSRSECSDNDADPYLRPSQRSRSRDSYWGSDQEYDGWVERPYWSEGPDSKSESLHRKRVLRHKTRPQPQQVKTQSPFEDDFAHQSVERIESPSNVAAANVEALSTLEPRMRVDLVDQKREQPPASPSSAGRCVKEHHPRREGSMKEYSKRSSYFEDELTPTASASSDTSDRQRHPSDLKATPEELPCDGKEHQHQSIDSFPSEDGGRDSFYNGDLRFDDDAFAFKSELEDNVPDHRTTMKNARQMKYTGGNNNNNNKTGRGDQYIRKSESVNIFARENDPFDDDDFFN